MKFLVLGSLNIDYVYTTAHIVKTGETIASESLETVCGGKGLNQAIALAKAGAEVWQGGLIGEDGGMLRETAASYGVRVDYLGRTSGRNGHAIIQVDKKGQNSIVLYGGSNRKITSEFVRDTIGHFSEGDCLILQNEINLVEEAIQAGHERGMKVVFNPSPFAKEILEWDISKVDCFFLNEVEGAQLAGTEDISRMTALLAERFPEAEIVLTLGGQGAVYICGETVLYQPAIPVKVVDTTAAGDTFTGYFMAAKARGYSPEKCMKIAAAAASLAVGQKGAAPSIPVWNSVLPNVVL